MRNKIVEEIYAKSIPEKIATTYYTKFTQPYDRDDYVQEMYLILLTIDYDKLIKLYKANQLDYYFYKVCRNQLVNYNSEFHKLMNSRIKFIPLDSFNYEADIIIKELGAEEAIIGEGIDYCKSVGCESIR